jgi:hypothetical protein
MKALSLRDATVQLIQPHLSVEYLAVALTTEKHCKKSFRGMSTQPMPRPLGDFSFFSQYNK